MPLVPAAGLAPALKYAMGASRFVVPLVVYVPLEYTQL